MAPWYAAHTRDAVLLAVSDLQRLYMYAKGSQHARENFTTEALAALVRRSPQPFVAALAVAGLLPEAQPALVFAATQVYVPAVGQLDLVVQATYEDTVLERWVEVKVDAGESGQQLANYARQLEGIESAIRPALLTLGPRPLGRAATVPHVRWQAIYREASGYPDWADFRLYLEEIGMANAHDQPIGAAELLALGPAAALYNRLSSVLGLVLDAARSLYPQCQWPEGGAKVKDRFQHELDFRGRFTVRTDEGRVPRRLAYLYLGAWHDMETPTGTLGLWVESDPRYGPQRRRLLHVAESGALPASWQRRLDRWRALTVVVDPSSVVSSDGLVDWFLVRIEELSTSGVLDLLPELGRSMTDASPVDGPSMPQLEVAPTHVDD
jgi:hypothetical protein